MLTANIRDYKKGYTKHFESYKRMQGAYSDTNSRRLLLFYCVECGLKYLLLDKWGEMNPKEILENPDDRRRDVLASHNLEKMIKKLGQQGNFKFHQSKTVHKEQVLLLKYC